MMSDITVSPAILQVLTFLFATSLAVSLFVTLRHAYKARENNLVKALASLRYAWLFSLLAAASLVTFVYAAAHANTLDLLRPNEVLFSRAFVSFVFGALYVLPVLTLVLEETSTNQTQPSSKQVHSSGRHHGTF